MIRVPCETCGGRGILEGVDENYGAIESCPTCLGAMTVELPDETECPMCKGQGGLLDGRPAHPNFQAETCRQCGGAGRVSTVFKVRDTIPIPDEAPTEPSITYVDEDDVFAATGSDS